MKTLTIARRFCGPAASANGGYFAGMVATLAARTLSVRLKVPPPLDTEFSVAEAARRRAAGVPRCRGHRRGASRAACCSMRRARPSTCRRWKPRGTTPASATTAFPPASSVARSACAATACASSPVRSPRAVWWRRPGCPIARWTPATARCARNSCRRRSIARATTRWRPTIACCCSRSSPRTSTGGCTSANPARWWAGASAAAAASTRPAPRCSTARASCAAGRARCGSSRARPARRRRPGRRGRAGCADS